MSGNPREPARRPAPRIVLIGYRGSGKTRVGSRLAERMGVPFADTDAMVAAAAGANLAEVFARQGEAAFRALESQAVEDALASDARVISVGGGAVLSARNRDGLRACAHCVWLRARAATLRARLALDPNTAASRPALGGATALAEIEELLAARTPLYEQTAHSWIDTDGLPALEVAERILTTLAARQEGMGSCDSKR